MKARTNESRRETTHRWWLALLCAAALAGCAGDELVGANASSAIGASPLPEVERAVWESAPAGCEGLLEGMEWTFGVAQGAPELVVVVDPYGGAVCADTYSAVDEELRAIGSDRVDGLWLSYVTTLQELEVYSGMTQSNRPDGSNIEDARSPLLGEPNPQPNRTGDPLPEIEENENDPNPQPNAPTGEGSAGSSGSDSSASSDGLAPSMEEPTEAVAPTVHAAGL